jgi:succinate dehydrogenase / fumarate reductase cytochrome b subunit
MASHRTRYFAKKLFELTGFLPIGAFLLEHLYQNFQAVGPGGAERFNTVVKDLQTNPLIVFLEIGMIGLPLLYHAGYGLFVAQQMRMNNASYGWLRNWTYLFQRVTGVILLFYITYHVWNTRLAPLVHPDNPLLQSVNGEPLVSSAYMHNYFLESHFGIQVFWIYVVGIACAVYHFANGLWNVGIHWGLTVSPRSQRLSGLVCGAVGVTLFAVGLASLIAFTKMQA